MKGFLLIFLLLATSCQNSYKKFFTRAQYSDKIEFYSGEPKVFYSNDFKKDLATSQRKGYGVVGYSNFNSGAVRSNESKLKELAKEIGAEVVLWNESYSHTVSGVSTYTYYTPQTQTSYYSGNINNNYSPTNSYHYSGNMTTYSQQRNTAYVPYNIPRYDYSAMFLGKISNVRFGFLARDLLDDERVLHHLKSGVYVAIIVDNSPAYSSDLAEGDVVLKIDKTQIKDMRDFMSLDVSGLKKVKIEYLRDGKKKVATVKLN